MKKKIIVILLSIFVSISISSKNAFAELGDNPTLEEVLNTFIYFPIAKEDGLTIITGDYGYAYVNINENKLIFDFEDGSVQDDYISLDVVITQSQAESGSVAYYVDTNNGNIATFEVSAHTRSTMQYTTTDPDPVTYTFDYQKVKLDSLLPNDFPMTDGDAWVNETGSKIYLIEYAPGTSLYALYITDNATSPISYTGPVPIEFEDYNKCNINNYFCDEAESNITVLRILMSKNDSGKLQKITVEAIDNSYSSLAGTYFPKDYIKKTIADIVTGVLPTSAEEAWENDNGQLTYISDSVLKIGSYSIGLTNLLLPEGDNYSYTYQMFPYTKFIFNVTEGVLSSIEVIRSGDELNNGIFTIHSDPTPSPNPEHSNHVVLNTGVE